MGFWSSLGKGAVGSIPVVGSMVQSAIDAKQSRKNVKQTIEHQKEMQAYQYSKDLEQWERENLYNLPSAQMSRLKDAGLNPAMIYGSGGAQTIAATSPKYQASRPDYMGRQSWTNIPQALSMYQDFKMKDAQIDTVRAERDMKELRRNWLMTKSVSHSKGNKFWMRPNWGQLYDTQLQVQKSTLDRIKTESERTGKDAQLKAMELEYWKLLKGSGMGGKIGIPLLRLLLGR